MPSSVIPGPGRADSGEPSQQLGPEDQVSPPAPGGLLKRVGIPLETIVWKRVDGLELCADIFYPPALKSVKTAPKRPIGKQAMPYRCHIP